MINTHILQVNGGIHGAKVIVMYQGNGSNEFVWVLIKKLIDKSWWHSWRQALLGYFTLGGFGSPEKGPGFCVFGGDGLVFLLLFAGLVCFSSARSFLLWCWDI